jgi:TPR repeat protein
MLEPLARAGNVNAQFMLGNLNASGEGVKQNYNQAYIWYGVAAKLGSAEAATKKNEIAQKLQAAEIQQCNRAIDRWQPSPAGGVEPH